MSSREHGRMIDINSKQKVELHLDSDIKSHPNCVHGPTLLFSRGSKKFYACSTFRDRKDCDFYLEYGDKLSQKKMCIIKEKIKTLKSDNNFSDSFCKIRTFLESKENDNYLLTFCEQCGRVANDSCSSENHRLSKLTKSDFKSPVSVLRPKSQDKKEAQYFFSESSSDQIMHIIKSQCFTNVLCVGCPSLFENLPPSVFNQSLLIDIDARLKNFYGEKQFLWGNFFNGHFFHGQTSAEVFQNFLIKCDKLLIIFDPPFGAKTELISHSLNRVRIQLAELSMSATAHTVWVYPYFMESQVTSCDPRLVMADFRVTYAGHAQYGTSDKARKLGSPVRLFTDIPLAEVELTDAREYAHCARCRAWRHVSNVHCSKCGTCPSKDGRTYRHCSECGRCVKPTYQHCAGCGRCALPEHQCGGQQPRQDPGHGRGRGGGRQLLRGAKRPGRGGHKGNSKRRRKHAATS